MTGKSNVVPVHKKIEPCHSSYYSEESTKSHAWRARVLCVFMYSRDWRASALGVLTCVHACYDEIFYFLACFRAWCAYVRAFLL